MSRELSERPLPRVGVALPDGWVRGDDDHGLTARPPGGGPGAPTVLVLVGRRVAERAEEHALRTVRELSSVLSDMHLVSLSVHDGEVEILVAHEMLGVDVTTHQRHVLGPDDEVVVAASTVADLLWEPWRPVLERVVGSVRVDW